MMKKNLFVLGLFLSMVSGIASANSEFSGPQMGKWNSPVCMTIMGDGQTRHYRLRAEFNEASVAYKISYFGDRRCTRPAYDLVWNFDYNAAPATEGSDLYNIDLTVDKVTIVAGNAAQARLFNRAAYCGVTAWVAGNVVEVSGANCGGQSMGKKGTKVYNNFAVKEKKLYIDFDASSASVATRPIAASKVVYMFEALIARP